MKVCLWVVEGAIGAFRIQILLQIDAKLFPYWLEFSQVLFVLVNVLNLCLYACIACVSMGFVNVFRSQTPFAPSNILTAVG